LNSVVPTAEVDKRAHRAISSPGFAAIDPIAIAFQTLTPAKPGLRDVSLSKRQVGDDNASQYWSRLKGGLLTTPPYTDSLGGQWRANFRSSFPIR